ncbi:MAG: histidine phosphatase family protein [Cypionkella sp.]
MTRLAILRHGHTSWNRAGRIQGRTDIALDPAAVDELSALRLPAGWGDADLCSSPLKRARDTASLVTGRNPVLSDALIEMNWGQWEGLRGHDLAQDPASGYREIESWGWYYRPPGGETPLEVWARLKPWVTSLRRDTVAVCHIGVMRVLLAQAEAWAFQGPCPFRIKRNRLYIIEIGEGLRLSVAEPIRLTKLE